MKCPTCGNKSRVEINLHAAGFARNLQECGDCGSLWTLKGEGEVIVLTSTPGAEES